MEASVLAAEEVPCPDPPSELLPHGQLTIAEVHASMLHISRDDDPMLAEYAKADGVLYPHIMLPLPDDDQPQHDRRRAGGTSPSPSWQERLAMARARLTGPSASALAQGSARLLDTLWSPVVRLLPALRLPAPAPAVRTGPVRAFAWHPCQHRFAVALHDDSVHVFDVVTEQWLNGGLSAPEQASVTSLAWKPCAGTTIAVGSSRGITVWTVTAARHVDRVKAASSPAAPTATPASRRHGMQLHAASPTPRRSCARPGIPATPLHVHSDSPGARDAQDPVDLSVWVTHLPQHAPVAALAWRPDGHLLASASPDPAAPVLVWDMATATPTPLCRMAGGCVRLAWSPNGYYLFGASAFSSFRVWETRTWRSERWASLGSPVTAAAWSPDSQTLLVAVRDEAIVHSVHFQHAPPEISGKLIDSESLAAVTLVAEDGDAIVVGGPVRELAWDPTGERLVVAFTPSNKPGNELLAVFATRPRPLVSLRLRGFIRGPAGASAECLAFQNEFPRGALLSCGWSNGKLAMYPMYFTRDFEVDSHPSQVLRDWHGA